MSHTGPEVIAYMNEIRHGLNRRRIRLRDIRADVARFLAFAGDTYLMRSTFGMVTSLVKHYYTLPERIELFRRSEEICRADMRAGDLDESSYKNVRVGGVYGMCEWWLNVPEARHAYGDVRLLRPIIGELLIEASEWERVPYGDDYGKLGIWYEELAPGGSLYPDEAHLAYVARFEAFAEQLIWDGRGQEYLTIVNFPAPPRPMPLYQWWATQHIVPAP